MTSPNSAYVARALAHVWHPCTQMKDHEKLPLITIRRGQGAWLEDYSGQRYLDAISSWGGGLVGDANRRETAGGRRLLAPPNAQTNPGVPARRAQPEQVLPAVFPPEPVIALSEALSAIAP